MTNTDISNMADVIDSRDIIERLEELQQDGAWDRHIEHPDCEASEEDREIVQEIMVLHALAEEASGYAPDWEYGECLIRDSYFQDYAQQLAEDCCEMPDSSAWPARCIDWEQAARELQMDYTSVDYDGITYWIR